MDFKSLLLSKNGRIGRQTFLFANIGIAVVMIVLSMMSAGAVNAEGQMNMALIVPLAIVGILGIWVQLMLAIKRWHDRDKSGYFVLLSMVPLVNIWAFIVMFFMRGTPGENKYGPDPVA